MLLGLADKTPDELASARLFPAANERTYEGVNMIKNKEWKELSCENSPNKHEKYTYTHKKRKNEKKEKSKIEKTKKNPFYNFS